MYKMLILTICVVSISGEQGTNYSVQVDFGAWLIELLEKLGKGDHDPVTILLSAFKDLCKIFDKYFDGKMTEERFDKLDAIDKDIKENMTDIKENMKDIKENMKDIKDIKILLSEILRELRENKKQKKEEL